MELRAEKLVTKTITNNYLIFEKYKKRPIQSQIGR